MNNYRFILDKNPKKYKCPGCGKKTFVQYIDTTNGEALPEDYGRCDREIKCGYFLCPYKDGYSKTIWDDQHEQFPGPSKTLFWSRSKQDIKKPAFIPFEILKHTRKGYEQNIFIQNLLHRVPFPFSIREIEQVISLYQLGTVCKGYRAGAVTFPFIDINGNIRAIQAKRFDETNHTISTDFLHSILQKHFNKEIQPYPDWLNSYLLNDTRVSCLFGEHLLSKYQLNPVALVEAPKTAIIGTLYFGLPDNTKNMLWLAVYNVSSLTIEKCRVLKGREVFLFPDLNAFQNWSNKAKELSNIARFTVSDLLEQNATIEEKRKGLDLADYLIKFPAKAFEREPMHLYSTDIISGPVQHPTGPQFNDLNTVFFKTKNGNEYDLLFNAEGELVRPGEQPEAVNRLTAFYEKKFQPAMFDNSPCWVHIDKPFIINNN